MQTQPVKTDVLKFIQLSQKLNAWIILEFFITFLIGVS